MESQRKRLIIDFKSRQELLDFVSDAKALGLIPKAGDACKLDALSKTEITPNNTAILRKLDDGFRPF